MKQAQHIANYKMPQGWCADDPQLSNVPLIYFHDRTNISSEEISKSLGAPPAFEAFYIGTAQQPLMDNFEPLPAEWSFKHPTYFKWFRPQLFQLSPFKTTLSLDDDAIP